MVKTLYHDTKIVQDVQPQTLVNASVQGNIIDAANFEALAFIVNVASTDADVTLTVEAGNQADLSDAVTVVTHSIAAGGAHAAVLDIPQPAKRYYRLTIAVGAGTSGAAVGAVVAQYHARYLPVGVNQGEFVPMV